DQIIKNTYRTLFTRGMRGCYVYCTDEKLAEYLRARLKQRDGGDEISTLPQPRKHEAMVVPLRRVTQEERVNLHAVPLIDLKIAAGQFGNAQSFNVEAVEWVEVPDWVSKQPGLFVAQVIGESMNRRIPNGSWCLFRANPQGTRSGKVVVAQHHSIQ